MKKLAIVLSLSVFGCGSHNSAPGTFNPVKVPVYCANPPVLYDPTTGSGVACAAHCVQVATSTGDSQTWSCPDAAQAILKCSLGTGQIYHLDSNGDATRVCNMSDSSCCDVSAAAQSQWN